MVKITVDVDPSVLYMRPQQAIQQFSLELLKEREVLLRSLKGIRWNDKTACGNVVECTPNYIIIEGEDRRRQEVQMTGQRLRQLLAAATIRK